MSATEAPAAPAEAPKGPVIEILPLGQNLARVVLTISNQASLARFQQELQTLGQHFGRLQQLQQRIQVALTTVERDALTKVAEAELKDFNEKDAVFSKVWGFNVPAIANRQSTFVNTGLRLLAVVSEEELAKARADKNFKEEQVVIRGDRRLLQTAEIRGFDLVVQFDQFAKVLQARRDAFLQLTEPLKRAEKDADIFRFKAPADQRWTIEVQARPLGSRLDALLTPSDTIGTVLQRNADAPGPDAPLEVDVQVDPAYRLHMRHPAP